MWQKITSSRDPRDTIYSELKKEFSPYVGKANSFGRTIAGRYPKFLFGSMVSLIVVSMALSFTVFRHYEPARPPMLVKKQPSPIQDGFTQILATAGEIKATLKLKNLVDSITAKSQLSLADSIVLDSALSQLQRLHSIPIKKGQP
jgi:hypothetical protein